MTEFLPDHPGGGESITINAGTDSTDEFNTLHGENARKMLEDYYVGELVAEKTQEDAPAAVRGVLALLFCAHMLAVRVRKRTWK